MRILIENDGRIFEAENLNCSADFSSPFDGAAFPCLIWDHDGRFTETQRSELARTLIQVGCRYAVCGGVSCEKWHDVIDMEFVALHLDDSDDLLKAEFVMTTWHDYESPDEVAFFFVLNTNFDDHDFRRYLVLHIGTGPAQEQVDAAVRKFALNKNAI